MKKYLTAAILLALTLFLCACGADVNSAVTVNPDGSGERVMVMTVSKSDLKLVGKKSVSEVDSAIAESCPDCMTYAYEENEKTVTARFTLPFSSFEDYENKLNSFCDKKAEINGYMSDSPFAREVEYSENISSREMLKWLPDALIEKKVLNERYRASVFNSFNTKLIVGGAEFDGGAGRLSVNDHVYCQIDSIDIYTTPVGSEKYNRLVKLNIRKEELEKNRDGIDKFLSSSVPENAFGTWESEEDDSMQVYSISMTDFTADDMTKAMQKYTGGHAKFNPEAVETSDGIFESKSGFTESLDWTNYICSETKTVPVRYVLDSTGMVGEIIDMAGGAFNKVKGSRSDDRAGYLFYDLGENRETAVQVNLEKHYHFSSIDYLLDAKNRDEITKEITLHFDNATSEDIGAVCDKIRRLGKDDEIAARIGTELSQDSVKLVFTGKADEINYMMNTISGNEGATGVSYAREGKWLVPLEDTIVEDVVDFDGFVYKDPNGSEYWQIPVKDTAKVYGVGQKVINDQPLVTEKLSSFEGKFTADSRVRVLYQTKRVNGFAFLWYLLLLVALAGFVGGVYFLIRSFIEKKREAKEELTAKTEGVGEAKEIEEKQPVIERITDAEIVSTGAGSSVENAEETVAETESAEEAAEEAVAEEEPAEEAAEEAVAETEPAEDAAEETAAEEEPAEETAEETAAEEEPAEETAEHQKILNS